MSGFEQLSSTENACIWVGLDSKTVYYNARYQGLISGTPGEEYILCDSNDVAQLVTTVIIGNMHYEQNSKAPTDPF